MGWVQRGEVMEDDGFHGDDQMGDAASIRFMHTELPGRLVTAYAYPSGEESWEAAEDGSRQFLGEGLKIQVAVELMICGDIEDPGSTEKWSDMIYHTYKGSEPGRLYGNDLVRCQDDALEWIRNYPVDRITWSGHPTR